MGHFKRDCRSKPANDAGGGGAAGLAMMATVIPATDGWEAVHKGQWVLDSGASHHMTGDASSLTEVETCPPVEVALADERSLTATTSGVATLTVDGPAGPFQLTLSDVLVVPGLTVPLLSVRQASGHGFSVEFHQRSFNIKRNGEVCAIGRVAGRLYTIGMPVTTGAAETATAVVHTSTWHRRLGHLAPTSLARMATAVTGMEVTQHGVNLLQAVPCPPCITGKITRAPFHDSTSVTTAPLQLVHVDVDGPMPVHSAGGAEYLGSLVDDFTRFKAVVPLTTKGQVKEAIIEVVNLSENQTGDRIKVIRTDGGLEFTGGAWPAWVKDKGVEHQRTTRYTPQQNGVAERYNRTVIERVLALLADSGLPPKYWAEAAVTISYLGNRVPHRGRDETPYEAFYGTKPDVSHLRVFGCKAWVYTPGAIRRKLMPRAVAGTFLGYGLGQKGWRVLVGDKVEVSRDVRFDETPLVPALRAIAAADAPSLPPPSTQCVRFPPGRDALDGGSLLQPGEVPAAPLPPPVSGARADAHLPPPGPLSAALEAARLLTSGPSVGGDDAGGAPRGDVGKGPAGPETGSGADDDVHGRPPPPVHADQEVGGEAGEAGNAGGPAASRHPTRLLRANPPHRGHASAAWVPAGPAAPLRGHASAAWVPATGPQPRLLGGHHSRGPRASVRTRGWSAAHTPPPEAKALRAWAMAASASAGPDKMHIRRAMREADWAEFDTANRKEVDALWANGTWELTDLPPGKVVTATQMICERKRGADGSIERYKGRFVVRGDTQTYLVN